ncbi:heterokaryon incompatibility protein-domain-containing protein [Xylariomycetidae sp. FL0641]|nr:heterokaryon incompatibility protein-domain-containing protein [Xylariomycetidae sp. FL0641]
MEYSAGIEPRVEHVSREQRSYIQNVSAPSLRDKNIGVYEYESLPKTEKVIRLLRLRSGTYDSPQVVCELFEAKFDENHVLHEVKDASRRPSGTERETESQTLEYEALSWCWGEGSADHAIMIEKRHTEKNYMKRATRDLALALKHLRRTADTRILWIDALCINQEDYQERNHQVQMMSLIYSRAKGVCVWLGLDDDESTLAMKFIRHDIMNLENFDAVSSNDANAKEWEALLSLMQRPWFSRRWVVQEIALANDATIYCGQDQLPWTVFAVAVELFVEVETATHRLSEVMQKSPKYFYVPGFFEYVSELGASLLVTATGSIFRKDKLPSEIDIAELMSRRSLLSLENLVSTLFVFDSAEPRDAIYSLLAIARDTTPYAEVTTMIENDKESLVRETMGTYLEKKPFPVDYGRPFVDVCQDFVSFCIGRNSVTDPSRALDVLCRPWAPLKPDANTLMANDLAKKREGSKLQTKAPRMPMFICEDIRNSPEWLGRTEKQKIAWLTTQDGDLMSRITEKKEAYRDKLWKDHNGVEFQIKEYKRQYFPGKKRPEGQGVTSEEEEGEKEEASRAALEDMDLPSWIAKISKAPYTFGRFPGVTIRRMGRKNADPLVGPPEDGRRNYTAAQTRPVDLRALRFRKRPHQKHYSLYVKGFKLTQIEEVGPQSQGGSIPAVWTRIAGWHNAEQEGGHPPPQFWRTLVADRGKDTRNPPYYYATACKESIIKGGLASGAVETKALVEQERNSIIAQFCRRMQAVIWNRALIKTRPIGKTERRGQTRPLGEAKEPGHLGLVNEGVHRDDLVCILYGCTVPVVLRRSGRKSEETVQAERYEDRVQAFRAVMAKCEQRCMRKVRYHSKQDNTHEKMDAQGKKPKPGSVEWREQVKEARRLINEDLRTQQEADTLIRQIQAAHMKTREERQDSWAAARGGPVAAGDPLIRRQNSPSLHDVGIQASVVGGSETTGGLDSSRRSFLEEPIPIAPEGAEDVPKEDTPEREQAQTQDHLEGKAPEDAKSVAEEENPEDHDVTGIPQGQAQHEPEEEALEVSAADAAGEDDFVDASEKPPLDWNDFINDPLKGIFPGSKSEKQDEYLEEDYYSYEFLGESYIHGMMDGDAIQQQFDNKNGLPEIIFELR